MKINTKKLKYGTVATVITVIVIVLVVLLNVIVSALGERYNLKFDLTPNSNFEISKDTTDYLAKLNENVEICTTVDELLFETTENIYYRQAYEVLKKYAQNSDKVDVNFVDMTVNPTYVEKYRQYYSGSINDYSIVIFNEDSKRIRVVSVNDLFNTEFDYNYFTNSIVSSKAEQVLTSAIMYVTDPDPKTAVYLNVISQSDGGNITDMLETNGFDIVTVDPLTEEIPTDADLIVINAPLNDFSEELIQTLYNFMENGGNYGKTMIYTAGYSQNATPNINAFIEEWGIKVGDGIIAENNAQNRVSASSPYNIKAYIESGDYTGGIPEETLSNPVAVPNSRPLELVFTHSGSTDAVSLLNTSETAFVMTNEMMEHIAETNEMPEVTEQEISVMALSRKYAFIDNVQTYSNLIVFGSEYILDSSLTSMSYYNNGDYFVSLVNKLFGKEDGLYIVAKDLSSPTYETNEAQANTLRIVFMFVLPGLVAAAGIAVWLKRRHK
ncbi:MAG: GldG family protein [Ruminococcus sp.]|nr:GldG family protein [Ruminococcus sp.]